MTRDQSIIAAHRAGESCAAIAARYNVTPQRVSQIAGAAGLRRCHADKVALGFNLGGRPRLGIPEADARYYRKLQRTWGVAYAREAMGL